MTLTGGESRHPNDTSTFAQQFAVVVRSDAHGDLDGRHSRVSRYPSEITESYSIKKLFMNTV